MQPDDKNTALQGLGEPGPSISKSKFLSGLQCPKLLWHQYNAKDVIPQPDAATQAIFAQGHEVGQLAKQVFPSGIEVKSSTEAKDVNVYDLAFQAHVSTGAGIC